ncbi:fimbrillin family protein [Phocaeicola vulgatus]|nr:fimbrillin family protein [Phocaeicola vulgatus]
MEHLLCLLEFTIEGSGACTLSVEDVPTGGTYDLAGGKLSAGEKGTVPSEGNTLLLLPGKAGNNRVVIRFQENTYGWSAARHPGGREKIRICIVPGQRRGTHSFRCKCPSLAGRRRL